MHNKRVWLIGASEGIGAALAHELAARGATLLLSARHAERLEALRLALPGNGHEVHALDVCSLEQMQQVWQAFAQALPDIVVYNAGAYLPMEAQHLDMQAVETMLDVNLRGAFRCVATVLPAWLARGRGHVVLVGSVAGYRGLPAAMGYGASKAGVNHLAENLRADLKGTGVMVQLVCPGFVKTRLTDQNTFRMPCIISAEEAARRIAQGMASKRFEIHFPRRFSYVMKLLRVLPYPVYFRLL